ncbi:hypothetical protein, partial [Pseudomonas sp. GL-RE-19]|uniref:hypothetical protein n=1 Tax=Pseudomonas sp. GL-RE-19 TaxID=2832389 RepID=UPI001CBD615C
LWQQRHLRPSLTFNKSLHDHPRYDLDDQKVRQSLAFSHSLDPLQSFSVPKTQSESHSVAVGEMASSVRHQWT